MNILEKLTNEKTNEDHLVNIGNLTLLIFQNVKNIFFFFYIKIN